MFLRALKILRKLLSKRDKVVLLLLLGLSVVISFIETVSISAIMIFISAATNFDMITKMRQIARVYQFLGCSSPSQFIILFGLLLAFFYVVRAVLSVGHMYLLSRFAQTRYQHFSNLMVARFLRFPYRMFVDKNPSSIGHAIFSYTNTMTQMIFALLTLIAEVFTVLFIYAMLFYVNWKMTMVLSVFLGIKSFIIIKVFSRSIARAGRETQRFQRESSRVFHEAYGNFKLVKLGLHEQTIVDTFSEKTLGLARAQMRYTTIQNLPRFLLETIGFLILISMILYVIYFYHDAHSVLPTVSLYALAFYRLFPSLNKMIMNVNQVIYSEESLVGIADYLSWKTELVGDSPIPFQQTLCIENMTFGYAEGKPVIRSANLVIKKGERVAFVGPSGSGKSTIVDVLMGLYEPWEGRLVIDSVALQAKHQRAWRNQIGYIPQSIYLFDGTIGENVVFGRSYDEEKLVYALKRASLYDFLQEHQGLETKVGEGGVKLSGGQKQRVAIARALYTDPQILVLDEATSALDHATESSIMNAMYQTTQGITLIIIAHRLSTVERCDTIYSINQGVVTPVTFAFISAVSPVLGAEQI